MRGMISIGRCLGVCAGVLSSAALSCGDGDGDGAPNGASEVVCPGDRWAANADMLQAIAGCTVIAGNVSVTSDLTRVELPLLTRIDGFFTVWSNPLLTRVALPRLARVGGYLDVSSNVGLTSLDLPALESVNERRVPAVYDVVVRDNALAACQTDALRDRLLARGFRGTFSISGAAGSCPTGSPGSTSGSAGIGPAAISQ